MSRLDIGDAAPPFTACDDTGKEVSLASYAGKKIILYFYPAAMTPGCTLEALDFNSALHELHDSGYDVLGVSPDTPETLAHFRVVDQLRFTLLSDAGKTIAHAYQVWGSRMLYGKEVEGVIRSTFVIEIDSAGVGVIKLAAYNVQSKGHVARILNQLGLPKIDSIAAE